MKFYKEKNNTMYWCEIINYKLNAIYCNDFAIRFYKNGERHNTKNASFIRRDGFKIFNLNDKFYGYKYNFTKSSWRKFVKLQAFL